MKKYISLILFVLILAFSSYSSARDYSKVKINTIKLTPQIYMLMGAGGNMGLSIGENGPFLIDDQFAPLTGKILSAIKKLSDQPVKFLVNTHWHGDHTGGNESIGRTGSIIVAHENVRKRMAAGQFMKAFNREVPPAPKQALPVVTFPNSLTFHWNNETIEVLHFPQSHTDGDAVIFFRDANVIHTGDLFFNGLYPFIDSESGGSISGMIDSIDALLNRADNNTQIIPGHGPLANKNDLKTYRDMLATVNERISAMLKKNMSVEQIIAAKPTADYDEKWGKGFLPPDTWVKIVCGAIK